MRLIPVALLTEMYSKACIEMRSYRGYHVFRAIFSLYTTLMFAYIYFLFGFTNQAATLRIIIKAPMSLLSFL